MRRIRVLSALALIVTLALTACGGGKAGDNAGGGKTELKLYNDKGAWGPYFQDVGKLSKEQIGLSMTPVGYTDEPTYEAFS